MKKILISDLDGTLLNSKHAIDEKNMESIKKWNLLNNVFVLATGRIYPAAKMYHDMLNLDTLLISSNGAVIHDKDGNIVKEHGIPFDIAKKIWDKNIELGNYVYIYSGHHIYGNGIDEIFKPYIDFHKKHGDKYKIVFHINDNFEEKDLDGKIHKIAFIHRGSKAQEEITEFTKKFSSINVFRSAPLLIDIVSKNASKGIALEEVIKYYKIKIENTGAIGDNENDISMIEKSQYGIVMGNANNHIKNKGDYVTTDNDNFGFTNGIEWLLKQTNNKDIIKD